MVIKKRCLFSILALLIMPLFLVTINTSPAKAVNPEDCYFGSTIKNPDKEIKLDCNKEYDAADSKPHSGPQAKRAAGNKALSDCQKAYSPLLPQCIKASYCIHADWSDEDGTETPVYVCTRAWRYTSRVSPKICSDAGKMQKTYNDDNNIFYWNENDDAKTESSGNKGAASKLLLACKAVKGCVFDPKKHDFDCSKADKLAKENKPFPSPDGKPTKGDANTKVAPLKDDPDKDGFNDACRRGGGSMAFFVCPGVNLMLGTVDMLTKLIAENLKWTMLADKGSSAVQDAWQGMLNTANIILAIVFMVMLYTYAINVDNRFRSYTIKQALSRLIIVAICMQLSFYICAALADLSNIAGVGVFDLLVNRLGADASSAFNAQRFLPTFQEILAYIAILFAVFFNFTTLIMIACAILAMIALRQVSLVTLTLLSPFAFACYLLPNTEKWFKKWSNSFIQLLIVFPFFTAAWGGCNLAALIIEDVIPKNYGFVIAPLCAIAPLAMILPIFKMSSSMMGKITSKAQGAMDKTGISSFAKSRDQARRTAAKNRLEIGNLRLQNHLARKGHKLTSFALSYTNGTRAAYITNRSNELTSDLTKKTASIINKNRITTSKVANVVSKPQVALRNAAVDNYRKKLDKIVDNPNVELNISDEAAAKIAAVVGSDKMSRGISNSGKLVFNINGQALIRYQAMTGMDINGKNLNQAKYQAILQKAQRSHLLSRPDLNVAVLNVQAKGDKNTRQTFINEYTNYNLDSYWTGHGEGNDNTYQSYENKNYHHIFMDENSKKDFVNQTGNFKAGTINSQENVKFALREGRRSFVESLDATSYSKIGTTIRAELLDNAVRDGDLVSVSGIEKINNQFISTASHTVNIRDINHAKNIGHSINAWRQGNWDEHYKTW